MDFDAPVIMAYIGPGAGLGAVGSLLAVGSAVVVMVVGLVWYPVRELCRSLRARREGTKEQEEEQEAAGSEP